MNCGQHDHQVPFWMNYAQKWSSVPFWMNYGQNDHQFHFGSTGAVMGVRSFVHFGHTFLLSFQIHDPSILV
jgi:hypothetical protein